MIQEDKQAHWAAHVEGWEQSELTQPNYCKQKNISYAQFGYWRTRLNRTARPETQPGAKFSPVKITAPLSSTVNLYLPEGIRLDVPSHSLGDILPVIYRAVRALPQ